MSRDVLGDDRTRANIDERGNLDPANYDGALGDDRVRTNSRRGFVDLPPVQVWTALLVNEGPKDSCFFAYARPITQEAGDDAFISDNHIVA